MDLGERGRGLNEIHTTDKILFGGWGGGDVYPGAGDYCTATGKIDRLLSDTHRPKHPAFRVVCRDREYCENVFRMGSGNSSFTTKSCACVPIPFLAGIISLSVESSLPSRHASRSSSSSNHHHHHHHHHWRNSPI
jgi:hypothetical protein